MAVESNFKKIEAEINSNNDRLKYLKLTPLLSAALPFVDPALMASGTVCLGVWAALNTIATVEKKEVLDEIHPDYMPTKTKDASLADSITLGLGMPFATYKNELKRYESQVGKMSAEQRKKFDEYIVQRMQPAGFNNRHLCSHVNVTGSTGLGKTELMMNVVAQQIARGGGLGMLDAKGDEETLCKIYSIAQQQDRVHDLLFLNFDRPDLSMTYNPFLKGKTRHIISTTEKMNGETKEEFFKRINMTAIAAAVVCILGQPEETAFNFKDLAVLFSDPREFIKLYKRMDKSDQNAREFVALFLSSWIEEDKRSGEMVIKDKRYEELMLGLKGIFLLFSHSEYAELLNDYSPDIELLDAILTNKIIIITVPALSDKEGAQMFGRLFLADFARAVGEINNRRIRTLIPFLMLLDEYGSIAHDSHIELLQQARSANISMWLATQGRGFLDNVSQVFGDNMGTNCWNHLYLDVRDPKTRDTAIKIAGTTIREFKTESVGESMGGSHMNTQTSAVQQESHGKSTSTGYKEMREDLIQSEDFSMGPGEAILVGKFDCLRLQLAMQDFDGISIPELEDIVLPRGRKHKVEGLNLSRKFLNTFESRLDRLG